LALRREAVPLRPELPLPRVHACQSRRAA
jgi:hypothetical protein